MVPRLVLMPEVGDGMSMERIICGPDSGQGGDCGSPRLLALTDWDWNVAVDRFGDLEGRTILLEPTRVQCGLALGSQLEPRPLCSAPCRSVWDRRGTSALQIREESWVT